MIRTCSEVLTVGLPDLHCALVHTGLQDQKDTSPVQRVGAFLDHLAKNPSTKPTFAHRPPINICMIPCATHKVYSKSFCKHIHHPKLAGMISM